MIKGEKVVVTGMGVVSAIGQNLIEFKKSLKEGRNGIRHLNKESLLPVLLGAKLNGFDFEKRLQQFNGLPEKCLATARKCSRRTPLSVQTSVLSALEACEQARLLEGGVDLKRMCLVVAGHNISPRYSFELTQKYGKNLDFLPPSYALHFMDADHIGTLSEIFEIQGEGYCVGNASASGNIGIIHGYRLIKHGLAKLCMVVGAMADLSPMEIQAFYGIGAMGGKRFKDLPEKACRPFDKDHEGFIYGQASGCLILESAESAKERTAASFGEIGGGGVCLDANRLANPSKEGEIRAMLKAMEDAKVEIHEIDLLNAHGTSSPIGDETEIAAVKTLFKDVLSGLWINSTKSMTGHCLYSAGVVECIATLAQLNDGFVHPILNLENPIDQECRFVGMKSKSVKTHVAMSNSFGFGGINTAIIIRD